MPRSRMLRRTRQLTTIDLVLVGYGSACLLMGGASAAGAIANGLLQFTGLGILTWLALRADTMTTALPRSVRWMLLALAGIALVQFLPLPPQLWGALPGRAPFVTDYELLGTAVPWLSLSLSADRAMGSVLALIPFVTTLFLTIRSSAKGRVASVWVLAIVASLSIVVGSMQLFGGSGSKLYFYQVTNRGTAVGFFANRNHLATLFVMTLPFVAALASRDERPKKRSQVSRRPLYVGLFLFLTFGAMLNGSSAGLALLAPSISASVLIYARGIGRPVPAKIVAAGALIILAVLAFAMVGPFRGRFLDKAISGSNSATRGTSIGLTIQAARAFLPLGSGIGSFRHIYTRYENPATVNREYVNHAHCDWAEIALETGLMGAGLLLIFCAWLVVRGRALWSGNAQTGSLARAALTALALLLLHSLVDYPARTAAILSVVGMAVGLVALPKPTASTGGKGDDEVNAQAEELRVFVGD